MGSDDYKALIEWQRATQVKLAVAIALLTGIFIAVVLVPTLQHFGLVSL